MPVIDIGREVTLEFIRVTEAAALKASRWMGRGEKEAADQAAVDAMRGMLDLVSIRGTIIIGEGEKDQAPCSTSVRKWAAAACETRRWTSPWIR